MGFYTDFSSEHGFLLDKGRFTTIDVPGRDWDRNLWHQMRRGRSLVWYFEARSRTHGFLLDNGTFVTIDVPGAPNTRAHGIDATGRIAGIYETACFTFPGFVLSDGTFTTIEIPGPATSFTILNGINAPGRIVGYYGSNTSHGLLVDRGTLTTIDVPARSGPQSLASMRRGSSWAFTSTLQAVISQSMALWRDRALS